MTISQVSSGVIPDRGCGVVERVTDENSPDNAHMETVSPGRLSCPSMCGLKSSISAR